MNTNIYYSYICMYPYVYFLLINTLIKPYDRNDKQHIIDKKHGIIDIIKIKGDISKIKSLSSFSVQLHNDILLSSKISVIFIYK